MSGAQQKVNGDKSVREKEREEKEKMMKMKCTRPECANKGLHRCKRCKTVSIFSIHVLQKFYINTFLNKI